VTIEFAGDATVEPVAIRPKPAAKTPAMISERILFLRRPVDAHYASLMPPSNPPFSPTGRDEKSLVRSATVQVSVCSPSCPGCSRQDPSCPSFPTVGWPQDWPTHWRALCSRERPEPPRLAMPQQAAVPRTDRGSTPTKAMSRKPPEPPSSRSL